MAEAVIHVTEHDEVVGPMSKLETHQGSGHFHRAFSVLLFNTKGEMLLQQRSADKVTFPSVWANACCSHPLHSPEEMEENGAIGVKRAAVRKLEQELGIDPSSISTDDMIFMSKMRYAARMNSRWIEREVDFYNFLEAITAVATGFDLLLGVLAEADTTREAASAIGVIFILMNS